MFTDGPHPRHGADEPPEKSSSFRFEPSEKSSGFRFDESPPAAVDDVAEGLAELKSFSGNVSGLLVLLLEICVGGLLSPVGLAMISLFVLLYLLFYSQILV